MINNQKNIIVLPTYNVMEYRLAQWNLAKAHYLNF